MVGCFLLHFMMDQMVRRVEVEGRYRQQHSRHVSSRWPQIRAGHEEEFRAIRKFHPGTFNVILICPDAYEPPGETEYRTKARERGRSVGRSIDGNHLSPRAKVVEVNG